MAAVTVGTGIRPERTTCCDDSPLLPLNASGEYAYRPRYGPVDRWECYCGCFLRVARSGFAPRGLLLVTEVNTDACRRGHRAPAVPDFFVDPEADPA